MTDLYVWKIILKGVSLVVGEFVLALLGTCVLIKFAEVITEKQEKRRKKND